MCVRAALALLEVKMGVDFGAVVLSKSVPVSHRQERSAIWYLIRRGVTFDPDSPGKASYRHDP